MRILTGEIWSYSKCIGKIIAKIIQVIGLILVSGAMLGVVIILELLKSIYEKIKELLNWFWIELSTEGYQKG